MSISLLFNDDQKRLFENRSSKVSENVRIFLLVQGIADFRIPEGFYPYFFVALVRFSSQNAVFQMENNSTFN